MILIDDVYQKVLALANKEQRGYITPQEFNLFADKAQLEIFDSYFYNIKTEYHQPTKSQTVIGDELDMISEKLHPFYQEATATHDVTQQILPMPNNMHKLITVTRSGGIQLTEITPDEINYVEGNPLTKATINRPTFTRINNGFIRINPTPLDEGGVGEVFNLKYYAKPTSPKWGYVVVKGRALYNSNDTATTNFMLHASEEEKVVMRILQLAGISIMKPGIVEVAMSDAARTKQEQNS